MATGIKRGRVEFAAPQPVAGRGGRGDGGRGRGGRGRGGQGPGRGASRPLAKRLQQAREPDAAETDEERARRRMEMVDDSSDDEGGEAARTRVAPARRAAPDASEDDSEDASDASDDDGASGDDDDVDDNDNDDDNDDDDDDESGSEEGSSGSESDDDVEAPAGLGGVREWRASLADVAFEDIEKLRKDGARVQPLAKRSAGQREGGKPRRENKNRPSEVTSKRPVARLRLAHGFDAGSLKPAASKRVDPRFEAVSGKLDDALVRQRYAFVYEGAAAEAAQMKAALKAHRAAEAKPTSEQRRRAKRAGRLLDADAASELQRESDRRTSMLGNKARADRERKAKAEVKAKELKAVALGKRPFFAKQSVLKEAVLTKQYDELKKSGKLGAALAERRKRRATKQRKWMPLSRTERGGGGGGDE